MASAGPCRREKGQPHLTWHLVWCHKRCFRRTEDRDKLMYAARSLGGALLCFKTSCGFLKWLAFQAETQRSASVPPCLLLTDPAGMEPIMRGLQLMHRGVAASMLLCEEKRALQGAAALLQNQPADLFSVHQNIASVIWKLVSVSSRQFIASMGRGRVADLAPRMDWASTTPQLLALRLPDALENPFTVPMSVDMLKCLVAQAPYIVAQIPTEALPAFLRGLRPD